MAFIRIAQGRLASCPAGRVVLLAVLLGQLARKIALSSPRSLDSDSVEEEERDTVEEDGFR